MRKAGTEIHIAPNMPRDWARMQDLMSPPSAIENAAPISGRKAQLESFSVFVKSKPLLAQPPLWPEATTFAYVTSGPKAVLKCDTKLPRDPKAMIANRNSVPTE